MFLITGTREFAKTTRKGGKRIDSVKMSRAFVKEDVDVPERAVRVKPASGLPPGALNYMTAAGERRLRRLLTGLRSEGPEDAARVARLRDGLASATVVDIPEGVPTAVAFGTVVTVRNAAGERKTFWIVGVDEVELDDDAVSWVSPTGRALLGAEVGERVSTGINQEPVRIVKIEYPAAVS